ncbi:MAG: hypothetical protein DMG96_36405, partial [Acidobacteria bacterium]
LFKTKEKMMETVTVIEQEQPTPMPTLVTGSQDAAPTMMLSCYGGKLTREQLSEVHHARGDSNTQTRSAHRGG